MARHLTWCFKRTLHLTNFLNVHRRCMLIQTVKRNFSAKSLGTIGNTIIIPKLSEITEDNIDNGEAEGYKDFLKGTHFGENTAIKTLAELLSLTIDDATKIVKEYPVLAHVPEKSIAKLTEILCNAGFRIETIAQNPFLLTEINGSLTYKIKILEKVDVDINDAVHLFHLNLLLLTQFSEANAVDATYLPQRNRIRYFAERFNRDINVICHWLSYNHHILIWPIDRIKATTEIFLDAGISSHDIMNDTIAYKYRLDTIQERMKKVKAMNLQPIKLWMLRRNESDWANLKVKLDKRRYSSQNADTILSELFHCDEKAIKSLKDKLPYIRSISPDKLLRNAKILCAAGYSIEDIQKSPRVLLRKGDTLIEYVEVCKKNGVEKRHLWTFCLTRKKFIKSLMENKYLL
ncbi:uncharacterized protein mTTF [Venturia canescens]|uniref:uncharacterized protein mTTF n=1 Tax=Venturia canescens TaxID=32260 RepID=UPI001C9CF105|nr:uncharacterized protein LOC122411145 [Venturia canescens]